jgi:hypothetical protein
MNIWQHYGITTSVSVLELGWSDGRSGHWPTTSERLIDDHGNVDYIRMVSLDEPGITIKWRCGIASRMVLSMTMRGSVQLLFSKYNIPVVHHVLHAKSLPTGTDSYFNNFPLQYPLSPARYRAH